MTKWLKEPLLHFLVLGALIFALNFWVNGESDEKLIFVSLGQQEILANSFERTWQRPPTSSEFNTLTSDFIRQEIAYREAQAMQLDRDDIVVRRRMRQKLEMLAEDVVSLTPPTEDEQRDYFAANAEEFRQPAVLSIRQVYFNNGENATDKQRAAIELLRALQGDEAAIDPDSAGDESPIPAVLSGVRENELDSMFGRGFAESLRQIPTGSWGGPVASGFGLHLVRLDERVEGGLPGFDAVSAYVLREMLVLRRQEAIDRLYSRLAEGYRISIEAPPEILPATSR